MPFNEPQFFFLNSTVTYLFDCFFAKSEPVRQAGEGESICLSTGGTAANRIIYFVWKPVFYAVFHRNDENFVIFVVVFSKKKQFNKRGLV